MRGWASSATGLACVAVLALLLELAVAAELIAGYVVAPPSAMLAALVTVVAEEPVLEDFCLTFGATLLSTLLAVLVGVPLGYLLHRRKLLGRAYESWIGALFSAPLVLLYPIFLVVFGRSIRVVIAMGFVVAVVPIILKTREGLAAVRPVLVNVARAFNASEAAVTTKVLLPAARPTIFTGVRLGLIYAMTNIVGIEFLANLSGLGFLVGELYDRYDIPGMYAAIVCLILTSALFYALTGRLERWVGAR
ncbi:MAG: ABC transporter permease subunit [Proteobacteria bacterium]|nr:ABC transporter permease subunit [Pseudomonadota bacterium]